MNRPCYAFGDFCLDVSDRQLLHSGAPVPLPPKVFDTLLILVESSGHLIDKDEFMQKLWPGIFVGEDALARNISILRKALGGPGDSQTLIETVPTRGYRFVAAVRQVRLPQQVETNDRFAPAPLVSPVPANEWAPGETSHAPIGEVSFRLRRTAFLVMALALGLLTGLLTFWLLSPVPGPRVLRTIQMTHSGRVDPGLPMASDGARIYFLERYGDHWNLMQTSVSGGEPQAVAAPFTNTIVLDVSPDRANLLIGTFARRNEPMPLWIWPVQGGAPKRVGEITATHAAWCPNGRQILFTDEDGIYQIDADGANTHRFAATQGSPGSLHWSRDGRRLRFALYPHQVWGAAVWEINSDGTHLHRLLPGWDSAPEEWDGDWTLDDRYFLFESKHSGTQDIWAIQDEKSVFRRHAAEPARLTAGPIIFGHVLPGKDGHTVFVLGESAKNELIRYDLQSRQFHPFLLAIHTISLSYSRDGAWIAYVRAENSILTRMKSDGTQPLALTPSGMRVWDARWSPDGKQISFTGLTEKGTDQIFLVSAEGGTSRELFADEGNQDEAAWSPDGKAISFVSSGGPSASTQTLPVIQVLNLSTSQLSVLPGSRGQRAPRWSPDGHWIATATDDGHELMLLDLRSQEWSKLAEGMLLIGGPLAWSADSRYVYFQDILATNEPVYRIRLSDHKQELVTSFETFLRGGVQRAGVVTVVPDGSLIVALTRNSADIYSFDLDLP